MNQRLAELLDAALANARAGRKTPDQFLEQHPAEAAEIAPLLRVALSIDPAAAPVPRPGARARIVSQIAAGMTTAPAARRWWPSALHPPRFAAGTAAALVLLLAIGAGGLLIAAQRTVPGDSLYSVKRGVEQVEMALRHDDAIDRYGRLSARRLEELRTLTIRGDAARSASAASEYEREYNHLLGAAATAPVDQAERADRLAAAQVVSVAELRDRYPARAESLTSLLVRLGRQDGGDIAALSAQSRKTAASAAAEQAPALAGAQDTVPARAEKARQIFDDLRRTIDDAEQAGTLAPPQAGELRVLLRSAAALNVGGENAVLAASVNRIARAITSCAERGCATQETLQQLYASVEGSALALGLPAPPQPAARAVTPPAANTPAGLAAPAAPAGRTTQTVPPAGGTPPAAGTAAPAPPRLTASAAAAAGVTVPSVGGAPATPDVTAAALTSATSRPAATATVPPRTSTPALPPAAPTAPAPPAGTESSTVAAPTATAGLAAAAPATAPPTPGLAATPTLTPTPTATPSPGAGPAPVPSATP